MITFAVVGRNEAARLANAIDQAFAAARPEDEVWFVDSGSTDDSVEVARRLGVEVLRAPAGKGRAMAALLERRPNGHICFVDADIEASDVNIPRALVEGLESTGADMVVGEFEWAEKRLIANTTAIYEPLVAALFPEAAGRFGRFPLSGFRVLDAARVIGPLPPGFGAETHLNVSFTAAGRRTALVDIGRYWGPIRDKTEMGWELAAAILDHAERVGRLEPAQRPVWDRWVAGGMAVVRAGPDQTATTADDAAQFLPLLVEAAARPLPPAFSAGRGGVS